MKKLVILFLLPLLLGGWNRHGIRFPSFTGGNSQIVLNFMQTAGDYATINALLRAQSWAYVTTTGANCNTNTSPLPNELDTNGYPIPGSNGVTNCGGLTTLVYIPSQTELPGTWTVDWTGNGTVSVTGASSSSSSPLVFTPTTQRMQINITATTSGNPLQNLRFYYSGYQSQLNAGNLLSPYFKQIIRDAKIGMVRFEDWVGNFSQFINVTKWVHNKPTSYVYYWGDEFRSNIFAGISTTTYVVGSPGSVTVAVSCSAPTCTGENGAPQDKDLITVEFDTTVNCAGSLCNIGGTSLCSGSPSTCLVPVYLNLNGTGNVQVIDGGGGVTGGTGEGLYTTEYPVQYRFATLAYDAGLNVWIKYGGDLAASNRGIINVVPPAIIFQACNELGVYCWYNIPFLTIDPDSGYTTSLAQLAKSTLSPSLKFIVEPPDETWNGIYVWSGYASSKAAANWPSASDKGFNQEYGLWLSVIGQDVSAVYGGDRTKYGVEGCEWTAGSPTNTATVRSRFTSANYVTYNSGSPAYNYATDMCIAGYYNTFEYKTGQEILDAYNYVIGNSATQTSLAASYAATVLNYGSTGSCPTLAELGNSSATTNTCNLTTPLYTAWATELAYLNGLCAGGNCGIGFKQYEGGYSPNYDSGNTSIARSAAPAVTAMSLANPAVLTLQNDTYGNAMSAVVGMSVTLGGSSCSTWAGTYTVQSGVSGNQVPINLNNTNAYTTGCTMTYNGPAASIASVAASAEPDLLNYCQYTLSTPLAIRAGLAGITIAGMTPSSFNSSTALVVAIDSTGTVLTTNQSCASIPTGFGTITATISTTVNSLRDASKYTPLMSNYTTDNYNYFQTAGGTLPSAFVFSGSTQGQGYGAASAWGVFQYDIYQTPSPQWNAIATWNGGNYP